MALRKYPFWATNDIPDIGNGDPNKRDPSLDDPNKQADGWKQEKPLVQYMNWIQNLQGQFITSNNRVITVNDGYEASAGEIIRLNNSAVPGTVLLPADPLDGQWVRISLGIAYSAVQGNVNGNGVDIQVLGDQILELDIDWREFQFYFFAGFPRWFVYLTAQVAPI